jgi:2,3-diketo-5-methylthio-1-phosphopentane phosphatase
MSSKAPLELAVAAESLFADDGAPPNDGHARNVMARQQEALEAALRARLHLAAEGPVVVIYDVEGTTTPLPFVTKVLYPYSEQHMKAYIHAHASDEVIDIARRRTQAAGGAAATTAVAGSPLKRNRSESQAVITAPPPSSNQTVDVALVDALRTLLEHAEGDHPSATYDEVRDRVVALLLRAIGENSKEPCLKTIQGKIWRHGYEGGAIVGRVFDDAAVAIRQLARPGGGFSNLLSQHIFSSGSVAAQQLLFRYSSHGDLTPSLRGYHDPTLVGPKVHAASYVNLKARITSALEKSTAELGGDRAVAAPTPRGFIFVTDSLAELNAASVAGGIVGVLCVRPMNHALPDIKSGSFREALGGEEAAAALVSIVSFHQLAVALNRVLLGTGEASLACNSQLGEVADFRTLASEALKLF